MRRPIARHVLIHRLVRMMTGWVLVALTFTLGMSIAHAGRVIHEAMVTKPFRQNVWQHVLTESVAQSGDVDFDKLKASPRRLNQYMEQLRDISPTNHPDYFNTLDEVAAYWINAHNALALRLVLDHYPADNLQAVPNMMTDRRHLIGGVPTSLSDIETLLTRRFNHYPGIFFAITTLTRDAPPLLPEAYQGAILEKQLKWQARRYLQDKNVLSTFAVTPGACLGLRLGAWFRVITPGLAQGLAFHGPQTEALTQAEVLARIAKPYLSPTEHALMNTRCKHPIQIQAADTTFRRAEGR